MHDERGNFRRSCVHWRNDPAVWPSGSLLRRPLLSVCRAIFLMPYTCPTHLIGGAHGGCWKCEAESMGKKCGEHAKNGAAEMAAWLSEHANNMQAQAQERRRGHQEGNSLLPAASPAGVRPMPRVIPFPIPYAAIVEYRCPNNHRAGWHILAVQHQHGNSFLTLACRGKNCDYATSGMFIPGQETEPCQAEE